MRDGRVQALAPHLARLAASTRELYGTVPPTSLAAELERHARDRRGRHRLRVAARPARPGLDLAWETSPLDDEPAITSVLLVPRHMPGGHGEHKWLDRRALETRGEGTSLLLDTGEDVLEAAWANVWIREGRRLLTPPADGRLLPGVTRERLLALGPTVGLDTAVEPVSLARLRAADEIVLTSSLRHAVHAALTAAPAAASELVAAAASALASTDWP